MSQQIWADYLRSRWLVSLCGRIVAYSSLCQFFARPFLHPPPIWVIVGSTERCSRDLYSIAAWLKYLLYRENKVDPAHNELPPQKGVLMLRLFLFVRSIGLREEGQDLVEYALVVALIAFAAIAGMNTLATQINSAFSTISSDLNSAMV